MANLAMQKPRVVFPDANDNNLVALRNTGQLDRLRDISDFSLHTGAPSTAEEFLEIVGDAEAVLLGAYMPDHVLERAPLLRMISFLGLGAASFVNLDLAAERGIRIGVAAGYGDSSVAEHTLALVMASSRRIIEGDRVVRDGNWEMEPGTLLNGKTIGIVGFGRIGSLVAKLMAAIGMRVVVWTRTPSKCPAEYDYATIDEIFRTADVVSLHLPLNEGTRGVITEGLLGSMKPGSLFVNTARSALLEDGALERALERGIISAALDVFDSEPLDENSGLRLLPNVLMTPHQAFNTPEARSTMLAIAVDNIAAFFQGRSFCQA